MFDNAALLKVEMSQRAMHLSGDIRQKIYQRISQILDSDDWEEDSSLVRPGSFVTFLRSVVADKISRIPALGVSVGGDLLATWWNGSPDRSLFVRYYDSDKIEVLGSVNEQTIKVETVAGSLREALVRAGFLEQILDEQIAESSS